jgi:hypothetical protein
VQRAGRLGRDDQLEIMVQNEMSLAGGERDRAGPQRRRVGDRRYRQRRAPRQPAREPLREQRVDVLHHDDRRREVGRQRAEERRQGVGTSGGRTDRHDGRHHFRGGSDSGLADRIRCGRGRGRRRARLIRCERLDGRDLAGELGGALDAAVEAEARGCHRVERAAAERLVHLADVAAHRGGHDEHRARRLPHDLARGHDAVDARHDEIHQDEIGPIARALRDRLVAVARHPRDLGARDAAHRAAQRFDRQGDVVHDCDPHSVAPPMRSRTAAASVSS